MRSFPVAALMIVVSSAALAQGATAPSAPPAAPAAGASASAPQGITRDDYIAKARDAAEKRAAKRFDQMDADHDGVLTADEIAAYRAAHSRRKVNPPQ